MNCGANHSNTDWCKECYAVTFGVPKERAEELFLGRKDDAGKARFDLLPWAAVSQVVAVLNFGAAKYAPDAWRKVDGWRWRYFAAAMRHLVAWWGGEKSDPESNLHHLAHAACCVLFLLELDQ